MGMWASMLLVPAGAPLAITLRDVVVATSLAVVPDWLPRSVAFGSVAMEDTLDDAVDPGIDLEGLAQTLIEAGVPSAAAPLLARSLADREDVLDLGGRPAAHRPPTLFEHHALGDVIGDLIALLPPSRVQIDRALLSRGELNHCEMGRDGIARIRLLPTNGTTLAGRTHALVHELCHALIGVARHDGRSYAGRYGSPDYGRFLRSFDDVCDEEALVRAIADAWLLRRSGVTWTRTWPGAIDAAGRDLEGDDLAAWARARLSQGLGLPAEPVVVRRVRRVR
jgi:hypothetical protein